MNPVKRSTVACARLLLFCAMAALAVAAGAAEIDARTSYADGVTVKVTPKLVAPGAAEWEFAVSLDTHVKSLDDDLAKSAVLVDSKGGRYPALGWHGAQPGGHHREGVLRFKAPEPYPDGFELQIVRAGEAAPRVFRWLLK